MVKARKNSMKKTRITFLNIVLVGVCLVSVLTGCKKNNEIAPEAPAATESITQVEDDAAKAVSANGYVLKETEAETEETESVAKKRNVTDTKMSASDRTKLDNLIDEIGKEIDE
jgi:hypothetical protein